MRIHGHGWLLHCFNWMGRTSQHDVIAVAPCFQHSSWAFQEPALSLDHVHLMKRCAPFSRIQRFIPKVFRPPQAVNGKQLVKRMNQPMTLVCSTSWKPGNLKATENGFHLGISIHVKSQGWILHNPEPEWLEWGAYREAWGIPAELLVLLRKVGNVNILLMEEIRLTRWYGESTIYRVLYISGGAEFLPSTVLWRVSKLGTSQKISGKWLHTLIE